MGGQAFQPQILLKLLLLLLLCCPPSLPLRLTTCSRVACLTFLAVFRLTRPVKMRLNDFVLLPCRVDFRALAVPLPTGTHSNPSPTLLCVDQQSPHRSGSNLFPNVSEFDSADVLIHRLGSSLSNPFL